ncbi:hypothetical protein Plhal703r1_c05g0029401 [Plasmopara halstedii]
MSALVLGIFSAVSLKDEVVRGYPTAVALIVGSASEMWRSVCKGLPMEQDEMNLNSCCDRFRNNVATLAFLVGYVHRISDRMTLF